MRKSFLSRRLLNCAVVLVVGAAAFAARATAPVGNAEFIVHNVANVSAGNPDIAMSGDGRSVVVWDAGDNNAPIRAQRYLASGAPAGNPLLVSLASTGGDSAPKVAIAANGSFVVAYARTDSTPTDIFARRYDAAGSPVGDPFDVTSTTTSTNSFFFPVIAMAADGRFVIAWTVSASGRAVRAQLFDAAGVKVGGEIDVVSLAANASGSVATVDAGMDDTGKFLISVADSRTPANSTVFRFNANGTAAGTTTLTGLAGGSKLAVRSDGSFVAADSTATTAGRYDPAGVLLGTSAIGAAGGSGTDIAVDAAGNFVVTWFECGTDGCDIFAREFNADGTAQAEDFRVNSLGAGRQDVPAVAMRGTAPGGFIPVWLNLVQAENRFEVRGRCYGAAFTACLSNGGISPPSSTPLLTATDDQYSLPEDSPTVTFDPRSNDFDSERAAITITALGTEANVPAKGTMAITQSGTRISYAPAPNFIGVDKFTYTITAGGRTDVGVIQFTVTGVNDAPTAVADVLEVQRNSGERSLNVLLNDITAPDLAMSATNPGGEVLKVVSVTPPTADPLDPPLSSRLRVNPDNGKSVLYRPIPGFIGQETFSYTISDRVSGGLTSTATVTVNVREVVNDNPVDDFTFNPALGVACNVAVTSNEITVSGATGATPISVSGGEYLITRPGLAQGFTTQTGTVQNADLVSVRLPATSNIAGTDSRVTLTIGNKSSVFKVTTGSTGCTGAPSVGPFIFVDQIDVEEEALLTSNTVTISGLSGTQKAAINVSGGEYRIGSGAFTAASGTVGNGDTVTVRHLASDEAGGQSHTLLVVGGAFDIFSSTTKLTEDHAPDPFSFAAADGVPLATQQTSNEITVAGLGTGVTADVLVAGGTYSKNGGTFTSAAGSVVNGDRIRARHISDGAGNRATNTTVTVGDLIEVFTTITQAGTGGGVDTTPIPFTFVDLTNVPLPKPGATCPSLSVNLLSNSVTIIGISAPAAISITGGEYSINGGGFTAAAGTVASGQAVQLRHCTPPVYRETTNTVLTVGGTAAVFSSTTEAVPTSNTVNVTDTLQRPVSYAFDLGRLTAGNAQAATALVKASLPDYTFDHGFFPIKLNNLASGGSVNLSMTLPAASRPNALVICSAAACTVYQEYEKGKETNVISFMLKDGDSALGDNDGLANTEINALVGPAFTNPISQPAVSKTAPDASGRATTVSTTQGMVSNFRSIATPAGASSALQYTNGFFAFDVVSLTPGAATTITLQLPAGSSPTTFVKCLNGVCGIYPQHSISGDVVTMRLVDGGEGDADGIINGVIKDPGAPARTDGQRDISDIGDIRNRSGGSMPTAVLLLFAGAALFRKRRIISA